MILVLLATNTVSVLAQTNLSSGTSAAIVVNNAANNLVARPTYSITDTISSGVNGLSNFLNGSGPSQQQSFFPQNTNGTQTSVLTPLGSNSDVSTANADSVADCTDLAAKIEARKGSVINAHMPDDQPGAAAKDMGLDILLNLPSGINLPADALVLAAKSIVMNLVTSGAQRYLSNQLNKITSTVGNAMNSVNSAVSNVVR